MKKIAIIAAVLMLSVAAFAQVKVANNGKITTYEKGSTINISSKDAAEVYYDGILITIPKGKRVVISQNKAGNILISGDNLNGVKVMGQTLRSDTPSTYVVDLNRKTVIRTPLTQVSAANNKQDSAKNNKDQNAAQASQETIVEVSFPEVDQFVNEIVSEQAVQDVEEQLSPSAPSLM